MPARTILHVDMDAFYASVEQRERPELRGRPVIVGGPRDGRGVVSAASYEARRFGVHSAMPSRTAAAKCPEAVFVPPRLSFYAEVSEQIHGIFGRYTAQVESLSLDEAFLDVTASRRVHGDGIAIGRGIQQALSDELGLHGSVGVAPNKFLAKLGSDMEKPQGFVVLRAADAPARIAPLPIERLWGVGRATAVRMHGAGYHTFGALAEDAPDRVHARLGTRGLHLQALAQGRDERPVVPERAAKSIGRETTFAKDTADRELLRATCYQLAESVGLRLRRAGLRARTISLKLRFDTFETLTRDRTLEAPTHLDEALFAAAWELAERVKWPSGKVRLLGVSTSNFDGDDGQLSLFAGDRTRQEQIAEVADIIRDHWGPGSIRHAGALEPPREEHWGHG